MDTQIYPDVIHGTLTSLYDELEPDVVLLLEAAISYRKLRAFSEAWSIFDSFPPCTQTKSVIALEHSYLFLSQYRFKDAHLVLSNALASMNRNGYNATRRYEGILIRALLARTEFFTEGSIVKVWDSLLELRDWLGGLQIEEYTDPQVVNCPIMSTCCKENLTRFGRSGVSINTTTSQN